ncbi:MAG: DUF2974 domain-containing protein [Treponema sp.]|nr:DUF2974 domain-containing protein [Treponema sp.]
MAKSEISNLIDYVEWRGDIPFSVVPLTEVDAIIFSQLAYIKFDGLLQKNNLPLKEVAEIFKNSPDYETRSYMGVLINARIPELLEKCGKSERFKDVELSDYLSILDGEKEEQFAACVFTFDRKKHMVAFRGTDDSLIGWKEDFNISFLPIIPYQTEALSYFTSAAKKYSGDLYICGHSKAGNAAVYVAVNAEKKIQNRITQIYNFDGPGFTKDFYKREEYALIEPRLKTIFPENSIVGMVFYHSKDFKVAKSFETGVMQHDPLSWAVLGTKVVEADDFTEESKFFFNAFNEWADRLTADTRKRFVNILFDVINASGAKTNSEIDENKISCSTKMYAEFMKLNLEDKKYVFEIIHGLVKAGKNNLPMISALDFDDLVGSTFDKIKSNIAELKEKGRLL